jgi:hypothetical protein
LKNRLNMRQDIEKILIDYRDSDKALDIRNVAADIMTVIEFHINTACSDERENCAKLIEHLSLNELTGWEFAEEIRKRSDAEESQIDDYADGVNSVLYSTPEERKKLQAAMNELRREMLDNMR